MADLSREQSLIDARDQLLAVALQHFKSDLDVVGVFLSGSLAAGSADAYSDIDLRLVARPEKYAWFVEHRRDIPKTWPNFLFNEWVPGTSHCVSHFRPFVKIDIFYFSENALQPSPWYALPVKILHDPHDVIKGLLQSSARLRFEVMEDDIDYSISKGLAAALEAFRRTQRGELLFAQTLLDELRHHIMQADDWLLGRTPEDAVYAKFDKRGSREVMGTLYTSFCGYDSRSLGASLVALSRLYRRQIIQLHDKFALSRLLEYDLAALDPILSDAFE